jgi:hypothetical protein
MRRSNDCCAQGPRTATRWRRAALSPLLVAAICSVAILLGHRETGAELALVPVELQANLLAKVASYDRNMPARAGDRVRVLLLFNQPDAESSRFATRMQIALQSLSQVGGLPHEERLAAFTSAAEIRRVCQQDRIAIIIVGPRLGEHVAAIRDALDGVDVLSVAATPAYVPEGVVLGFDLVSSKPKLLVHLTRARRQRVDLPAEVLKLMRVYE